MAILKRSFVVLAGLKFSLTFSCRTFSPIFFNRCFLRYALTNWTADQGLVHPDLYLNDIWLRNIKEGECQFADILRCPEYVNLKVFCSDFMVSLVCQFTKILPRVCQIKEISQRFHGAPSMSTYRDLMVLRVWQFTEILLRFYGAPSASIYRGFMVPRVCPFTEILQKFHCALKNVNFQRFYGASEYVNLKRFWRDFMVPIVCQFTEILHDQAKHVKSL